MPSDKLTITLEQYNSARAELLARVPVHYQLIMFKIVSVGTIVSFFSSHFFFGDKTATPIDPMIYYSVWIVPFMATIFDLMIFRNFHLASLVREFLVTEIRNRLKKVDPSFKMWEQMVRDQASHRLFRVPLTLFLIPLFSTLVVVFAIMFRIVHRWTTVDTVALFVMAGVHIYAWFYLAQTTFWLRPAKSDATESVIGPDGEQCQS